MEDYERWGLVGDETLRADYAAVCLLLLSARLFIVSDDFE